MKHLRTFENFDTLTANPVIRHLVDQSVDYSNMTDRLDRQSDCKECPKYISMKKTYCGKCGNCVLNRDEVLKKVELVKNDKDALFRLKKCIDKYKIKID
jgi:hypothetical protein